MSVEAEPHGHVRGEEKEKDTLRISEHHSTLSGSK